MDLLFKPWVLWRPIDSILAAGAVMLAVFGVITFFKFLAWRNG